MTEKEYYTSKFESYTCNIKKTWQVIKNIFNKNGISATAQSFNLNNKVTSDKEEIVNKFNEYFVNIGPTLADKIIPSNVAINNFLKVITKTPSHYF